MTDIKDRGMYLFNQMVPDSVAAVDYWEQIAEYV